MKKISIISALALAAFAMSSCNDFLNDNRYPQAEQTNNPTYWNNESNVNLQCSRLYANFTGFATGTGGLFYFPTLSDNQGSGIGGSFVNWSFINIPTASTLWSDPYVEIRRCNYIINNVAASTLSENVKAKYMGIGRLIRAQQYYWLVRRYGDVPYVDIVIDPSSDTEILFQGRQDRDMVMDKVYEDLKFAAENIGSGSKTTFSSDLAYAMMSEICLYEGTYCKYRTLDENGKAPDADRAKRYLEYAANAASQVMAKNYTLNDSYIANYNSVELESNPEMIFYKEYKMGTLSHQTIQYIVNTTTIAGLSRDAFDAYLFKDGKPLALTSMDKNDAGYIKKGIVSGTGAAAAEGDMLYIGDLLAVRDNRLYETIDTVVAYASGNEKLVWQRYGSNDLTSSTGYLIRKFDNPEDIEWQYRQGSNYTCAPVYWLAVVLCDYAEAKAELGTLTDADLDKSLNLLYARAELPEQTVKSLSDMNDPANNMGVNSLIWEVRRCRRCETMLDNEYRYWDLNRWHQLDKLDTNKYPAIRQGANLKNATIGFAYMEGEYMRSIPGNERVYQPRVYLYPIPSDQITLSEGALVQQPLWK